MSSNRAWMPLHIGDYLKDTGHLNAAEHGAYMLMIMHYWQHGSLPADERLIARIAKLTPEQWTESRDILAMLFGPGWTHKRIDAELMKADDIIEKRRSAANARHSRSKTDASAVQTDSKSTDTGTLPRTYNQSSSSLHSEDDTPLSPPGGGGRAFQELVESYPASKHTNLSKAERVFRKLSADDQSRCLSQARAAASASADDRAKRGRDAASHAEFVKGLDAWLREGVWRQAQALPSVDVALIEPTSPDFAIIKAFLGDRLVLSKSGNATVLVADLEQARAAA